MSKLLDISEVLLELGLGDSATDTERAVIAQAIRRAEGSIRRVLRYDPVYGTRTQFLPAADSDPLGRESVWEANETSAYLRHASRASSDELQVQHLPIRSVTSLAIDYDGRSGTQDGAFATNKVEGQDFWPNYDSVDASGNKICGDGIIRSVGLWPSTPGSVKVVYVSGYTEGELRGTDAAIDGTPIWESALEEATARAKKSFTRVKKTGVGFVPGIIQSERLGDYQYSLNANSVMSEISSNFDALPNTYERLSEFINYGWQLVG